MRSRTAAALALAGAGAGSLAAVKRAADRRAAIVAPTPAPLSGRERRVATEDGIELAVTEHGSQDSPAATIVLAHGYVQSSQLWAGQVRDLLAARPDLRVVTYDHRGHGQSDRTGREGARLEQLGRDMARVIDAVAPTGPVLVAGHSMGGMTVMALAEQFPALFDRRIVGVALVGTSSGGQANVTYGLPRPVARLALRVLPALSERAARAEQAGRRRPPTALIETRLIFGRGADRADVRQALEVQAGCSIETFSYFLATFSDHDRAHALAVLTTVPVVILGGEKDRICPIEHSRAIAAALPQAELHVYPDVGHMVQLERREQVSAQLLALLDRALTPAPA